MPEPNDPDGLRRAAFEFAQRRMGTEPDVERWGDRLEAKVLWPLAREWVERDGEDARIGMELALLFGDEKSQANVFAHAIRRSADSAIRWEALGHIGELRSEVARSEGLMIAAVCPDKDLATEALCQAMTEFDDPINQNLVFGEALRNPNEEVAHLALNIARTIRDERRLGRLLRAGLRSEHPAVRDRCLKRARQSPDTPARNRTLRYAEELGLLQ